MSPGFERERVDRSGIFVDAQNHIDGIENFWRQAKRHLRRFNCRPTAKLFKVLLEWAKTDLLSPFF